MGVEEQWNLATESASSGGDRRGAIRWEAAYLRSGSDEGGREKDKENPVGSRGVTGIVALFFFFFCNQTSLFDVHFSILTLHMYNQLLDCFKPIHENSGLCTFRALETLCQLITFKTLRPMLEISNTSTPIWGIMARKGNNCIHQIYKLSRDLMKTTDFIKEQVQEL